MNKLWDPFDDAYRANPYSMYQRLRIESPVHRSQSGDIVVTQYSIIKNILLSGIDFRAGNRLDWIARQVQYLENKEEDLHAITDAMNSFIVMMNPPEHTQLRNIIMQAWDNHEVDDIIKQNINTLLDTIDSDSFDLISNFAEPLPAMTMTKIMGFPSEDYVELKKIASGVLRSLDMYTSINQLVKIDESSKSFIAYLNHFLDYREVNLSTDLISKIILQYKGNNIQVNRTQLISICIFLFMAGEETTVNLIGTGLFALISNSHQRSLLATDPTLLEAAADEALRFESPVQLLGRIANKDLELGGISIKKNDTVTLCIGAANRDPEIFREPNTFDISRNAKGHLAFGAGAHFCLGSWLAKKQWKMAVHEILQRFPLIKIEGPPVWNKMLSVRGLTSLKISTQ